MAIFTKFGDNKDEDLYMFFCPGCQCSHWIRVRGQEPCWKWNGDVDKPTISPSILINKSKTGTIKKCHMFVKEGKIQYLGDCEHELKNQTIDMEEDK